MLAVQLIAIGCFLLFPLQCTFLKPESTGAFGRLFAVLQRFDKPFNQAPSLHVGLAVILWACFSAHLRGLWRVAMQGWLLLVMISTMTTYQHQFIDLPAGVLVGLLGIALNQDKEAMLPEM